MSIDEELIRQLAREEWAKLDAEKTRAAQDACGHYVSGTLKDGILTCDACDKVLTRADEHYMEDRSPMEQRAVDHAKRTA